MDLYHEKFIETMAEWINEKERNVERRYYVLRLRDGAKRATLNIGVWTIKKDLVKRLLIRLAWFYKYPYSLEAEVRRVEMLNDKVFYVIPGDVVKVLAYVPWKKMLRKDEVKIEKPDDVFRLLDEISRYFPDDARNDLKRITKNLEKYESYVEY